MRALRNTCFLAVLFVNYCLSIDKKLFPPGCAVPRRNAAEILIGYGIPEQRHRYLGEITVQYGSGYERAEIMRRIRLEAARCGADGILFGAFSRVENTWKWADKNMQDSFDTTGYRLTVTMYRFE